MARRKLLLVDIDVADHPAQGQGRGQLQLSASTRTVIHQLFRSWRSRSDWRSDSWKQPSPLESPAAKICHVSRRPQPADLLLTVAAEPPAVARYSSRGLHVHHGCPLIPTAFVLGFWTRRGGTMEEVRSYTARLAPGALSLFGRGRVRPLLASRPALCRSPSRVAHRFRPALSRTTDRGDRSCRAAEWAIQARSRTFHLRPGTAEACQRTPASPPNLRTCTVRENVTSLFSASCQRIQKPTTQSLWAKACW